MTTVLWWVRRDLRLSDNQALTAAAADADRVVPVYLLDPEMTNGRDRSDKRHEFLLGGLYNLDMDLRARGSRLVVRRGDPQTELTSLLTETGATTIFAEEEYSPDASTRDRALAKTLPLQLRGGLTVRPPEAVRQANGQPHSVYTPFRRAWKTLPLPLVRDVLAPPAHLSPAPEVSSLPIPETTAFHDLDRFPPGEAEAQRRLRAFVDIAADDRSRCTAPIYCYDGLRDRLDVAGTSQLSPYLSLGMLSARQAAVSALSAMDAAQDEEAQYSAALWLDSLIWREFTISILFHYPDTLRQGFRPEMRNMPWERDQEAFEAWTRGRTGYPLVDAAMRQLVRTGWLHNRARRVAASFLVKDLLVDSRWGEQFFRQHLLDGDLAANNEGWQRAAGIGTGAAGYLGILNPALQGRKYDPDGLYVRHWLPELARVPTRYIHEPWTLPASLQREIGCVIGQDYPAPMLDHGWARDRAMAFFGKGRDPMKTAGEGGTK